MKFTVTSNVHVVVLC